MTGDIVLGVVVSGQQVLVGKTRSDKLSDFGGLAYVFPGGRVEEAETLEEAVVRELQEETGLDISVEKQIGQRNHPVTDHRIHYFLCQVENGDKEGMGPQNDDLEALEWISLTELVKYMPTVSPILLEYLDLN